MLFKEWSAFRNAPFAYKNGDIWDRMVHRSAHLLERFAQDNRTGMRVVCGNVTQVKPEPGGKSTVAEGSEWRNGQEDIVATQGLAWQ